MLWTEENWGGDIQSGASSYKVGFVCFVELTMSNPFFFNFILSLVHSTTVFQGALTSIISMKKQWSTATVFTILLLTLAADTNTSATPFLSVWACNMLSLPGKAVKNTLFYYCVHECLLLNVFLLPTSIVCGHMGRLFSMWPKINVHMGRIWFKFIHMVI